MEAVASEGEEVFVVDAFDMDQPALPGAVREVLDSRDHDEFVGQASILRRK